MLQTALLRQQRVQIRRLVGAPQPDDAPVPLHNALRVPGHVEREHRLRLLKILPLGEHISTYQNVYLSALDLAPLLSPCRLRTEALDLVGTRVRVHIRADYHRPRPASEQPRILLDSLPQILHRILKCREHRNLLRRCRFHDRAQLLDLRIRSLAQIG